MTSRDIRRQFLDFFASKGHKIIPSAPLVAKGDPTLLFINSGMAPLKDFLLGNQTPPALRVVDTQKCLRVSGKHNDLEDVGMDGYHHTLFEMLGNWSFGDYFKQDALRWSWELLTEVYKIPKDRLYVSVFGGDEKDGVPFDQEAYDIWRTMLPEDRIMRFGKKENFWEMGEQGPCGPCSEIHVDMRPDAERAARPGRDLVNADDPNVIEIWNNVFMQFNRKADRSLEELPAKSVDTGMGFERLCRAVQDVGSNYATDLWTPLFDFLAAYTGKPYTDTYPGTAAPYSKTDIAMRVVADHLRAVCFAIADGAMPSNTGAGYVIRRILRRGVRYYYSFLDIKEPVLYRMAPILAESFDDVFPELKAQLDFIVKVILEEEKGFLRTLESGLKRFDLLDIQDNRIDGRAAFELFDTYGFPFDLTGLLAREKGLSVDEEGFKEALAEQKKRSRQDAVKQVGDWFYPIHAVEIGEGTTFVGYDALEIADARILKYREVTVKDQVQYQLVLDRTPFYPEGGGQVGDAGFLQIGDEQIRVFDTKKENNLPIHIVERFPEDLTADNIRCAVDSNRRRRTESNHTATHLLHAALRQVLGNHVQQKGSYLDRDTLRFDFQHFQKVEDTEIAQIEAIVNAKIRENIALEEARSLSLEAARASGATMLFGEKYGETVRMITFDPAFSRELCGGCHVQRTGQIGLFKITTETAVAAGVRRIEAVTAEGAEQYFAEKLQLLDRVKTALKSPKDLIKAISDLQDEQKRLQKEVERLVLEQANALRGTLRTQAKTVNGISLLAAQLPLHDLNAIKTLANDLERDLGGSAVIALAAVSPDGKPSLTIKISDTLVKERQLHAGNMVRELAQKFLKGGGGGQAGLATAGGTDAAGLGEALAGVAGLVSANG